MITIRPVSRYNEFRLTPEHPVYAIKRENVTVKRNIRKEGWLPEVNTKKLLKTEPEWVKAGDLQKGDFILVPKLTRADSSAFSDAELELLGYYLAEGSTYFNQANRQYTNQLSFGLHEKELVNRAHQLVTEITGRPAYVTEQPDRNGAGISFYSQQYSEWFTEHCGKGATTKQLSPALMELSPQQTKVFLDAYLAGDGNVHQRDNSCLVRYCTASETLAQQVQMLLNKLNIYAWIQTRPGDDQSSTSLSRRLYRSEKMGYGTRNRYALYYSDS
jgi:Fe-S cluster assembly protein SufB